MTDKELQKLGRRELLQLLLDQAKETDRLSKLLRDTEGQLSQMEESYERLRERLDQKDAKIHELQTTLQTEREKRETDLSEVGSIAEAALRLNGVFDAAQEAANQYLQSVKEFYAIPEGMEPRLRPEAPPPPRFQAPAAPQPMFQARPEPVFQAKPESVFQPPPEPEVQSEPEPPLEPEMPLEPEAPLEWDFLNEELYASEPARPRPAARERERSSERRSSSQSRTTPFRARKRKENGKTTLFFGWQHD